MFEHVVVAAHFASASAPLLKSVAELKSRGTRRLTLVDVLRSHNQERTDEGYRKATLSRLEEARDLLQRNGFEVSIELRPGQPAHELSTIARAREASLILVGSRGENAFREFLRGSTVLQLMRKTATPVLMEPVSGEQRQITGAGLGNVLLATDFSSSAADAEAMAIELAGYADRVVLAHVVEDDEVEDLGESQAMAAAREKLDVLASRLPDLGDRLALRITRGSASREVLRLAEDESAGVMVVGKRGHSPVRELTLGSTAVSLVRRATCSLLVVPTRFGRI